MKSSVLFLASDPSNASRLRLGEELREIQERLQLSKYRDNIILHQRLSVRPEDFSQALLDVNPHVVHFSGHGNVDGTLCFEDKLGQIHPVQPDALAAVFEQFADEIQCVVLNACYSETQAKVISQYIDYVIGMNQAIGDRAAIAFAVGFYQALGAGSSVERAYKLGCAQIRLQNIPEHLTPVLLKKFTRKWGKKACRYCRVPCEYGSKVMRIKLRDVQAIGKAASDSDWKLVRDLCLDVVKEAGFTADLNIAYCYLARISSLPSKYETANVDEYVHVHEALREFHSGA